MEKKDLYQRITDKIVCQLEQDVRPWQQPWNGGTSVFPLRHNGIAYRGVNILALWMEAAEKGYSSPRWMTFKQALDLGGHVRKGETGSLTVYADKLTRSEKDAATGEEAAQEIHYLKGYTVFNADQIDGLPESYYAKPPLRNESLKRITRAEAFFAATGAAIVHGGSSAYYIPRTDNIHMPCFDVFDDAESYYATLAHECTHWTAHEKRLDRSFGRKRWGDEGYAMEELVAELGAAFLCTTLELTPEPREDHASYLANWLKVLKDDKRAIFTAASHAQRAADFLNGFQSATAEGAAA